MFSKNAAKIFIYSLLALLSLSLFACEDTEDCPHENIELVTVAPTCEGEGYTLHKCKDCTYEYKSEMTAPTGHTLSSSVTSPTCNAEGYTSYSCECGYFYVADYTEPLGHIFSKSVTPSSCSNQGYTINLCSVCSYSFVSNVTPPLPHELDSVVHEPTCDKQGFTEQECKRCDYKALVDFVEPLGHKFTETSLRPTSTKSGYIHHVCHCEYEYTDHIMSSDIFKGAFAESETPLARGIDVSKWNGELDWEAIKAAGFDFVIIRAGYTGVEDPLFESHYAGAKAAGLDVGAYFYSYAKTLEEIDEEADQFIELLEGKQFEYPVYLDIEDPSMENLGSALLTDMCFHFIEKMQLNGYFCGIYTNYNWRYNILDTQKIETYFDVWYARYNDESSDEWDGSEWGEQTAMWQYSCEGSIGEHKELFDFNLVFKDYPTLIKKWGYNGFSPTTEKDV